MRNKPSASRSPQAKGLAFANQLYGREREQGELLQAFQAAATGEGRVVLLSGSSGSGKTALAQSLREPVIERNGYFLEGKFNQYQKGLPLYAMRQALRQLVQAALEDASLNAPVNETIQQALGGLGRLLTNLVPELGLLLGEQPDVPEISPLEAPHRFATVLRRFLGVFCRPEHPLVLFIDDWQWADALSLTVLEQLQLQAELRYILLIVCYRDNEVDARHPLSASLEQLELCGEALQALPVSNLGLDDVKRIVSDALIPEVRRLESLGERIFTTTQGNPFFVRSLLETLYDRGELWFDVDDAGWNWQPRSGLLEQEQRDVTDLFSWRLQHYPDECRHLLSVAACMGHQFRMDYLALVLDSSTRDCLDGLAPALAQGVIVEQEGASGMVYRFLHDRVQQACHGLLGAQQLPAVRLNIGRLLYERLDPVQKAEQVIEITDHFNAGQELISASEEFERLIDLNMAAGARSRAATAYQSALGFFRRADGLLARLDDTDAFWQPRQQGALSFYLGWSECEFLDGDQEKADECLERARQHAQTGFDSVDVLCQSILQNTLLARYPQAIEAGRQALSELGMDLPEGDFEAVRDDEIKQVYLRINGRSLDDLLAVPRMRDPVYLAATRVLITMGPPCYRGHQRLWSVLVPRVVNLTLQHGPIPQVGYCYPAFSGLLAWVNQDFETGRLFKDLAIRLMSDVFTNPSDQSVFYLMVGSSSRHWHRHLHAAREDYARAWEVGLSSGNLQYAAYAFGHNMYCRFFQGKPLAQQIEDAEKSLQFSRSRRNQWAIDLLEGGLQTMRRLTGELQDPLAAWEKSYTQGLDRHNNIQVACIYEVLQAQACLLLGHFDEALAHCERAAPIISSVGTQGLLVWPEFVFSRILILCEQAQLVGREAGQATVNEARSMLGQLETWARHAPQNYAFKLHLAKACIARARGTWDEALECLGRSIAGARDNGFTHWEAYACDCGARVAQAAGRHSLAHLYWQFAYMNYQRWGASARVQDLESQLFDLSTETPAGEEYKAIVARYLAGVNQLAILQHPDKQARDEKMLGELTLATERLSREVAQRKQAEQNLKLAASVFEHAREGIMITDQDARIIDCNEAFTQITGYSRDEALGHSPRFLRSGRHDDTYFAEFWQALNTQGHWHGEIWNRRKNGEVFAELLTVSAVCDHLGRVTHYVGLFSDITELKEQQRRLELDAYHDALTGLPNRSLFADRLRQAMSQAVRYQSRIAVVFIDLDGFKQVNDRYGHDAGDQLLVHLAGQMKKVLRESDTLSRLGGDEFVCVARDLDNDEQGRVLLNRLLIVLSESVVIDNQLLQVSASVGATFYPQNGDIDAEQLLRQADQAMYQAKLSGKNRFHLFDETHDRSVRAHHETLEQIRQGIRNDEFVLFYQPKVDMRSGQVIGAEALVRWMHPVRGLLTPERFLPIIEEHPLIIELGTRVLEQAFGQLQQWVGQGLELVISVNIAARDLQQDDFIDRLSAVAERYDHALNHMIEFEILETSALRNIDHVSHVIEQCVAMGFSFSLDDFGTGYSSLTYLKRLPVDTIKIDKSFVRDMLDDADDLSILQGVIALAESFNRQVIAEGVETPEHGELLLWLGCTLGQGYGIARPMPGLEMPEWIATWQTFPHWQQSREIGPDLFRLLLSIIRHRTWINDIESYLLGAISSPPQMEQRQCRFESFVDQLEATGRGNEIDLLAQLHSQVHATAAQLVELKDTAGKQAAIERVAELRVLGDSLLLALRQFLG
jgi:diguanylate cyclase (GGDEF)-like protein/PAS domain S-box-containing protein